MAGGIGSISFESQNEGGGTVTINATKSLSLDHSNIDASTSLGSGTGSIFILAGEAVRLNEAKVSADASPETGLVGNGGNIVIEAGTRVVSEASTVSAKSDTGNGGNIIIQAPERISVDGGLVSTRAGGDGAGGNIGLRSEVIRLQDGAKVESTAVNGSGGTITIQSNDFQNVNGTVDAQSQFGPDGSVTILPLP